MIRELVKADKFGVTVVSVPVWGIQGCLFKQCCQMCNNKYTSLREICESPLISLYFAPKDSSMKKPPNSLLC